VVTSLSDTITGLLQAHRQGDEKALDRLIPLIYPDLRRMARRQMRGRAGGTTLDTTALVHEAYLKLVGRHRPDWEDRAHFFGVCARAMRQVIVDHARERRASKRGGGGAPCTLDETAIAIDEQATSLLAIDEALDRLAELDARLPRLVECRFFAGLTEEETAEALAVPLRTVQRDWARARAWLRRELGRTKDT
jgi:RNA polymerase sigma factor (TIGR02999 family)